jgi:hypothetical protein
MAGTHAALPCGLAALAIAPSAAQAAEGGTGAYLLGIKGPGAGITAPPGLFFSNQFYFYKGDTSATIQFQNGDVAGNADATAIIDLAAAQWVTPWEIFGGSLGFALRVPFGHVDIDANIIIPLEGEVNDDVFTVGDPNLTAFIGWHNGNFHLQSGVTRFFPIGDYQESEFANVAKNRLAADVFSALTWFDPKSGIDITNIIGVTFNAENETTDYKTGTEFHWEWAVTKKFSPQFKAGFVGYYYNQLTADSGSGVSPILGDFKGEVAAVAECSASISWPERSPSRRSFATTTSSKRRTGSRATPYFSRCRFRFGSSNRSGQRQAAAMREPAWKRQPKPVPGEKR